VEDEIAWKFMEKCVSAALDASETSDKNGIASFIVKDGAIIIIAEGANRVDVECNPTLHAEIVAIGNACQEIGEPDLSDCTLFTSLEPCEMCLGAIAFAGIEEVYFSAQRKNVDEKYFMYPSLTIEDFQKSSKQPLKAIGGLHEDRVLHLYASGEA